MTPDTYFALEIMSEDQLGLFRRFNWGDDQMTALAWNSPVGTGFGIPTLMATRPWLLHRFDWAPSSFVYLVSERLSALLRKTVVAEFLPVRQLMRFPGQPRFVIMNLLASYYALDRVNSAFADRSAALGGGIRSVSKLVLDRQRLNGTPAFVLRETGGAFFRGDVCLELERGGFKGLRFVSEHEWKFGV